ncbi:MAG: ABC transporter permease [Caldilineaceae bacterium]
MLVRLLPGDPASAILGDRATEEAVARINAQMGLDRPLPVQFGYFVRNFFQGELGDSISYKIPVSQLIWQRLPVTIFLTLYAGVVAVIISVPLAFVAAVRQGSLVDNTIRAVFQVGLSLPVFYVGLLLLTVLGAKLNLFPIGGYGDTVGQHFYHLFLPALSLGFGLAAILMRNLRAAIVEVLTAEYVNFARAKGLRSRIIMSKHVLRNAMISTVTLLGLNIGASSAAQSSPNRSSPFPVWAVSWWMPSTAATTRVQALALTFAILVFIVFLVTDLVYAQPIRVEMA